MVRENMRSPRAVLHYFLKHFCEYLLQSGWHRLGSTPGLATYQLFLDGDACHPFIAIMQGDGISLHTLGSTPRLAPSTATLRRQHRIPSDLRS